MSHSGKQIMASMACLFAVILLGGCSGSSPTEPGRGLTVLVTVSAKQVSLNKTMKRVQIRFDDEVIRDYSNSSGFSDIMFNGTTETSKGQHRVELRIMEQTATPTSYKVRGNIDVFDPSGTNTETIDLSERTQAVATGQGLTWTFTISR